MAPRRQPGQGAAGSPHRAALPVHRRPQLRASGVSPGRQQLRRGGRAAEKSPRIRRQILHPDRYLNQVRPVDVQLPGLAAESRAGLGNWTSTGRTWLGPVRSRSGRWIWGVTVFFFYSGDTPDAPNDVQEEQLGAYQSGCRRCPSPRASDPAVIGEEGLQRRVGSITAWAPLGSGKSFARRADPASAG